VEEFGEKCTEISGSEIFSFNKVQTAMFRALFQQVRV
jgi:hypothetical protein